MNLKDSKKLIALILIAIGIAIVLFVLRINEDDWICKNGTWVKHGNPTATMPSTPCK